MTSLRPSAARVVLCVFALFLIGGCKPRLDSGDPQERRKAVDRYVNDLPTLVRVAMTDPDLLVSAAAVRKIDDPAVLEQIVLRSAASPGRDFALARIEDQEVLARIAGSGRDTVLCGAALVRVREDKLLGNIVRSSRDSIIRGLAIEHLKDDAILKALYVETEKFDFLQRKLILGRRVELRGRETIDRELSGDETPVPERGDEARAVEGETGPAGEEAVTGATELPATETPVAESAEPAT